MKITKDAWLSLVILSSIALLTMYGETMLLPALPDLVKVFEIPYNTSSWILTSYLITGAVMTPVAGKLSDIYGKKKILVIIMAVYTIGTLVGGVSTNIALMITARIIQGIGLAMFPVAFGIIREKFPEEKLAIGQGIFTAVFSGGAVVGLGLGATVVENFGWRMTFLSVIPFAIVLFLIIIKYLHVFVEKLIPKIESSHLDVKGTMILTVMISTFLIGLTLLPDLVLNYNNNLILIISLFAISLGMLPFFIISEKNAKTPLIDFQLLKDSILLPANILITTIGISIFIIYQSLPILVQSPEPLGFGGSPVEAANVQLPFLILSFVIAISSGFLVSKIGNIKPTIFGCLISTAGFILLLIYHSTELLISIDLAIIAIGLSFSEIGSFNIVLMSAPIHKSGTSLGITMLLFLIGMSIGPAISGVYMQTFQSTI
ncbi:MAG: MFS transporter, partial [Candidatus Nitrosocosmicus sp.]